MTLDQRHQNETLRDDVLAALRAEGGWATIGELLVRLDIPLQNLLAGIFFAELAGKATHIGEEIKLAV